jgi:hypothetical protein
VPQKKEDQEGAKFTKNPSSADGNPQSKRERVGEGVRKRE